MLTGRLGHIVAGRQAAKLLLEIGHVQLHCKSLYSTLNPHRFAHTHTHRRRRDLPVMKFDRLPKKAGYLFK